MDTKQYHREIGRRIRLARKVARLTQQQLAEKVGSSDGGISRIEAGLVKRLSVDRLERIREALELPSIKILLPGSTIRQGFTEFVMSHPALAKVADDLLRKLDEATMLVLMLLLRKAVRQEKHPSE